MTPVISSGISIFVPILIQAGNNVNRPETVESLFIAFRLTGDRRYRDDGWRIFQSIQKHCRVQTGGYASIINVDQNPAEQEDKMETFLMVRDFVDMEDKLTELFWQSETLKYLYLLFSEADVMPLDGTCLRLSRSTQSYNVRFYLQNTFSTPKYAPPILAARFY